MQPSHHIPASSTLKVRNVRSARFVACAAGLMACAAIHAAEPEYAASVRQPYTTSVERIALAPFECREQLDCEELEEAFTERLSELGAKVLEPRVVRDLMARAGMNDLEQMEQRLIVAEGLRVQGLALVRIRNATIETASPAADDKWRAYKREVQVKRAELDLRIIGRDGSVLAEVEGAANVTGMRGLQGVVERLFALMVERATPEED